MKILQTSLTKRILSLPFYAAYPRYKGCRQNRHDGDHQHQFYQCKSGTFLVHEGSPLLGKYYSNHPATRHRPGAISIHNFDYTGKSPGRKGNMKSAALQAQADDLILFSGLEDGLDDLDETALLVGRDD